MRSPAPLSIGALLLVLGGTACTRAKTPADFSADWALVQEAPSEEEEARLGAALKERWEGATYTWTGLALASLCLEAKATCAVDVFDKKTTPKLEHIGGLFPRVTFRPEEFSRLKAACLGRASCVVTFRAKLRRARVDRAVPLALDFEDAVMLETRSPGPDDHWFRDPPERARQASPPRTDARSATAGFDAQRIKTPVF